MKAILDSILSRLDAIVRPETSTDAPAPGFGDALQTLLAEPDSATPAAALEAAELEVAASEVALEDANPDAALVLETAAETPGLEDVDGGEEAVGLMLATAAPIEDTPASAQATVLEAADADSLADLEAGRRPARLTSPDAMVQRRSAEQAAPALPSRNARETPAADSTPPQPVDLEGADTKAMSPASSPTVDPASKTNTQENPAPLVEPTSRTESQPTETRSSLRPVGAMDAVAVEENRFSSPERSDMPESGRSASPPADLPPAPGLEAARPVQATPSLEGARPVQAAPTLEDARPVQAFALEDAPPVQASSDLEDASAPRPVFEDAAPSARTVTALRTAPGSTTIPTPPFDVEAATATLEGAPATTPSVPAPDAALEVADVVERDLSQGRTAAVDPAARRVLEDAEPMTVDRVGAEDAFPTDLETDTSVGPVPLRDEHPSRSDRHVEVVTSSTAPPLAAAASPAMALAASAVLEDVTATVVSADGPTIDTAVPSLSDASAAALGTAPEPSQTVETRVRGPLPSRLATPAWLDRVPGAGQDVRVSLGEDGAVRLQTVRDADGVTVSVRFSDPELQALAAAHAPRLRELLENHFEGAVRLSLDSAGPDANADGHARDGAPARPRRDATHRAETALTASLRPRLAAAQSGREWIG